MHQAGGLAVKNFRDWILHTPGTKTEIAPGNRFLLEELLKTVHPPYGGILKIFPQTKRSCGEVLTCALKEFARISGFLVASLLV